MDWEVTPEGLCDTIMKAHASGRYPRLVITENGVGEPDRVRGDPAEPRAHEQRRLLFIQEHLAQVARARRDGAFLDGDFAWSLLNNFE
jgi:beta-glucosidase